LLARRAILLALPLLVVCAALIAVDPFDYFGISHLVPDRVKLETSYQLNACLWKMIQYDRRPCPNLLLGDSRMLALSAEDVSRAAGRPFANMAYGGSSLNEVIQTFWFASTKTRLREVWIGFGFNMYDDYNYANRTDAFLSMRQNPLLYFANRTVLKCAAYNVYYDYSGIDPKIGVPTETRDQFWQEQLGPLTARWYSRYVYPQIYHRELQKIADYCRANRIKLGFIIFPTHVELQRRVYDFGLEGNYRRFKQDLSALAPTFDFDYPSPITENRANFRDPYHFTDPIGQKIIHQVWCPGV
jgi:hypothetical protein